MKTVTTIEQLSKNLTEFHDYVLVPNKTSHDNTSYFILCNRNKI